MSYVLRSNRKNSIDNILLRDPSTCHDENLYYLPLHSNRVHILTDKNHIEYKKEKNFERFNENEEFNSVSSGRFLLSRAYQRQLRHNLEEELEKKYVSVENIINKKLLRLQFNQWVKLRNEDNEKLIRYSRCKPKRFIPEIISQLDDSWYRNRAVQIIYLYLWQKLKIILLRYFNNWKKNVSYNKFLLLKFYNKWVNKTNLIKLNRLNGLRYMKILLKSYGKKLRYVLLRNSINKWKRLIEFYHNKKLIKMLFNVWKLSIKELKRKRLLILTEGLNCLKDNLLFYKWYHDRLINKIMLMKLLKYFKLWRILFKKKLIIKKLLANYYNKTLYKAWNLWKHIEKTIKVEEKKEENEEDYCKIISPKKTSEVIEEKTLLKGVYQDPSDQIVYRKVKRVTKRRCCSYLMCSHKELYQTPHINQINKDLLRNSITNLNDNLKYKPNISENNIIKNTSPSKKNQYVTLNSSNIKDLNLLQKIKLRMNAVKEFEKDFIDTSITRRSVLKHSKIK